MDLTYRTVKFKLPNFTLVIKYNTKGVKQLVNLVRRPDTVEVNRDDRNEYTDDNGPSSQMSTV